MKHGTCAPSIFKKFPENQLSTDFIDLTSLNFVKISHIRTKSNCFIPNWVTP